MPHRVRHPTNPGRDGVAGGTRRLRRACLAAFAACVTLVAALVAPTGISQAAAVETATTQVENPSDSEVRLVVNDPVAAIKASVDPRVDLTVVNPVFGVITVDGGDVLAGAALALDAGATIVERDVVVYPAFTPTDPGWPSWWGARQVGLDDAWETTLGTPTVDIAIIDTGVNLVPELAGRVQPGYAIYPGAEPTVDLHPLQHGTKTAMVAAGGINNGTGASGSCPLCDIIPINVFNPGNDTAFLSDVANGITWATDNGAEIVNISLAGPSPSTAVTNAVAYAKLNGVVVVAAAGNVATSAPQYPASAADVVSVGALGFDNNLASYSNFGSTVELTAAGTNVVAGSSLGSFTTYSGTSSASPLVAGIIGLYLSLVIDPGVDTIRANLQAASPMVSPALNVAWGRLSAPALLALAPPGWPQAPFDDVIRPSFYATAVDWGWNTGVTTGTSASTFSPARSVDRAQAFTMLWRMAGSPVPTIGNPFSDVPPGRYFTDAAVWAAQEGITTGIGGDPSVFAPNKLVTRAQAITMLWREMGEPDPADPTNPFPDVPPGVWFDESTNWGFEQGITTGVGGTGLFEPARNINRAQHIAMLWRWVGSPPVPPSP